MKPQTAHGLKAVWPVCLKSARAAIHPLIRNMAWATVSLRKNSGAKRVAVWGAGGITFAGRSTASAISRQIGVKSDGATSRVRGFCLSARVATARHQGRKYCSDIIFRGRNVPKCQPLASRLAL